MQSSPEWRNWQTRGTQKTAAIPFAKPTYTPFAMVLQWFQSRLPASEPQRIVVNSNLRRKAILEE